MCAPYFQSPETTRQRIQCTVNIFSNANRANSKHDYSCVEIHFYILKQTDFQLGMTQNLAIKTRALYS